MLCDECRESEAEVHLTSIEKDETRAVNLCPACAARRGLTGPIESEGEGGKPPLVDFLAQLGSPEPATPVAAPPEPCPFCGTAASDFRETGRVGCAQCYVHFERQLRGLLRRIHGSAQHSGKLYISDPSDLSDRQGRISSMRRQLQRAVEIEDFETAAELRDRIHDLEAES